MKDWKKKMLMKVTTIRAKIMASTHSARADGFLPSLLRGFQKVQLTFFVTVHGEVCENLAVQTDVLLAYLAHELGVSHAILACSGIDTLDPERTE